MNHIIEKIQKASSILLSTHKQCDGDGLGAELGLYYALTKIGKKVQILNVDPTPRKLQFLDPDKVVQDFENHSKALIPTELALIFDTNDRRLVEPLYSEMQKCVTEIAFIDHHPVLTNGPQPTANSVVDINAASTGEMAYSIITGLGIELDEKISRPLYASIVFDTQLFRFIRKSPNSHLVAARLLEFEKNPEEVHRGLFGSQTIDKVAFLSKALANIEYFANGRLAILKVKTQNLTDHSLELDDSRDVIDMIMNIESLHAAALFRQDSEDEYKLSLRSNGTIEVLPVAEKFAGGGHLYSAGAFLKGPYMDLKVKVVNELLSLIESLEKS